MTLEDLDKLLDLLWRRHIRHATLDGNSYEFDRTTRTDPLPDALAGPLRTADESVAWMTNGIMTLDGHPDIMVNPNQNNSPREALAGYRWQLHLRNANGTGRCDVDDAPNGLFMGDPNDDSAFTRCRKCEATMPPSEAIKDDMGDTICACGCASRYHQNGVCREPDHSPQICATGAGT